MSAPIKIEGGRRGPKRSHPFWFMEVGDNHFFPGRSATRLNGFAQMIRTRGSTARFRMLTVTENGVTGVRVWRIG